ncbi:MAG: hypothetical protein OFPII_01470 [Osedax symbiont Rs1]|nr:MAG: hypothetical protein OFPII_01470 [Osedax symbiont Rs1]
MPFFMRITGVYEHIESILTPYYRAQLSSLWVSYAGLSSYYLHYCS